MNKHFAQNHPALYEEFSVGYTLLDDTRGTELKARKHRLSVGLFCTNILIRRITIICQELRVFPFMKKEEI